MTRGERVGACFDQRPPKPDLHGVNLILLPINNNGYNPPTDQNQPLVAPARRGHFGGPWRSRAKLSQNYRRYGSGFLPAVCPPRVLCLAARSRFLVRHAPPRLACSRVR